MNLGDKTHELVKAAGANDTTPETMKSMIAELNSDPVFSCTGAVLPMLQLALRAALTPGSDDNSERRLGVIRVIAEAAAENYGREYLRMLIQDIANGNPDSIINKIFGAASKKGRQE